MIDITIAAVVCVAIIFLAGLAGVLAMFFWKEDDE